PDEDTRPISADLLAGLVEKTLNDPGAPFAPDALAILAKLKKEDRAGFEGLHSQLKGAGCRVTALDDAIGEESGELSERAKKQADILAGLAQEAELFHAPDRTSYPELDQTGNRQSSPRKSNEFRRL